MKNSVKNTALIALSVYAAVSLGYFVMVLSGITDEGVKGIASLFVKQLFIMLVYGVVFGASFLLFELKLSAIAKRLLHIAVTYSASVALMLMLIASGSNPAQKLVYTVITTVIFGVVYGAACLLFAVIKKYKE